MKKPKWWNWGAAIAAVYITFAAATVSFVVFAIGQPVELVSADYYEQSLKHDVHMRAIANAEALGGGLTVRAIEDAAAIDIVMPLPIGPGPMEGSVTLYRPSNRGADRALPLSLDTSGRQRIALDGAMHGRWIVKLAWREDGRDFYREQAVFIP